MRVFRLPLPVQRHFQQKKPSQLTYEGKNGQKRALFYLLKECFNRLHRLLYMAGVRGFEPQLTDPESAVLPLNDTPMFLFVDCILHEVVTNVKH